MYDYASDAPNSRATESFPAAATPATILIWQNSSVTYQSTIHHGAWQGKQANAASEGISGSEGIEREALAKDEEEGEEEYLPKELVARANVSEEEPEKE